MLVIFWTLLWIKNLNVRLCWIASSCQSFAVTSSPWLFSSWLCTRRCLRWTLGLVPQFALRQIILLSHLILSCVRVSCHCDKGEWFVVSCWDAVDQRSGRGSGWVGSDNFFQGHQWMWKRQGGYVTWNKLPGLHKHVMNRENPPVGQWSQWNHRIYPNS